MKKLANILFFLLAVLTVCRGQSAPEAAPIRVSFIGPDGETLSAFALPNWNQTSEARQTLQQLLADSALHLETIQIRSGASLEGAVDNNQRTSDRRAALSRTRVLTWAPELTGVPVQVESVGEDYATLRTLLADSNLKGADEAIRIIDTVPTWVFDENGNIVSSRKKQLMDLQGGSLWHLMREELFPALRSTRILFLFTDVPDGDSRRSPDGTLLAQEPGTAPDDDAPATILSRERGRITALTPPMTTYFPIGSATIQPGHMGNAGTLDRINSTLRGLQANPDRTLTAIHLTSGASPDGPESLNNALSLKRADALRTHLHTLDPSLTPNLFSVNSLGEDNRSLNDWLSHAQQPLRPQAYYPWLRRTTVAFEYQTELLQQPAAPVSLAQATADQGLTAPESTAQTQRDPITKTKTIISFKTNLLFDAATMLNYAIEIPFGSLFSLVWEHYFPWWVFRNNRTCIQYLTLGGEARWWFAPQPRSASAKRAERDRLVGHYLGAYGLWGKTDLQWDRIGNYQCDGLWSVGLTYGFAFPISKHLNMELSLSAGYARIPYQHYIPSDDWQTLWRDTEGRGTTYYFGPTKLQVSLVWPLQITTRAKEGARK